MMNKFFKTPILFLLLLLLVMAAGCNSAATEKVTAKQSSTSKKSANAAVFQGEMTLSTAKGVVGTRIHFSIKGLSPNTPTQLQWKTVTGSYQFKGLYQFIGASFKDKIISLTEATSDAGGKLEGDFTVPRGFGGDHTIYVKQSGKLMTQANVHVNPTFKMSPATGAVGSEITITADGIGYDDMERNWQLTYDNQLTGIITAITTDGKAVAKIRASGAVGSHTLTIWHGYLGIPYINHEQAPTSYLPVPSFTYTVTSAKADAANRVEPTPVAADGGVKMPALKNKPGVSVSLDKEKGIVGEMVTMKAAGLPKNQKIDLVWNTMSGSRVSKSGFGAKQSSWLTAQTNSQGSFSKSFPVPDDLGGIPHRIDLTVNGTIYGQAYLAITPSIVKVSPASGPPGTPIEIEIKGVGWTEYDNTYQITYDNGYVGYVCGFNSSGTVIAHLIASGAPGYHTIDFYPGIYRGQQKQPDIYLSPQLTYGNDHPGSAIPAIRLGFEVVQR